MLGVNKILVAIDRSDKAHLVMEKAVTLAKAADAELEVVRVIYEGVVDLSVHDVEHSQSLKTYVMQSEESYLEDLIEPFRTRHPSLVCLTLWNKDTVEGILDAAEDFGADLIIKATNAEAGLGRTPADWTLLRHSTVPVMIVKPDAWKDNPDIFAAVDAIEDEQRDLSIAILKEASNLARIMNGNLQIVAAYPITEPWAEPSAATVTGPSIRQEVETMVRDATDALIKASGVDYQYVYIEEGRPAMAIKQLMADSGAELLVMGTVARTCLKGLVIGNTSEAILHQTDCDVVVIR